MVLENFKNYEKLKSDILNGSLSFEKVQEKLFNLDQSTPSRDASEENLKFLRDPQIVEYAKQHPEIFGGYQNFLSLTEFHVAQNLALNDSAEAIEHFRKALESSLVESSDQWTAYIKGTLLYIEGKEIPEEIIARAGQSRNAQVMRNFNSGLRKRGRPSYKEDLFL